jgi:hypothetical protein
VRHKLYGDVSYIDFLDRIDTDIVFAYRGRKFENIENGLLKDEWNVIFTVGRKEPLSTAMFARVTLMLSPASAAGRVTGEGAGRGGPSSPPSSRTERVIC